MKKALAVLFLASCASLARADDVVMFFGQTADCDPCKTGVAGDTGIWDITGYQKIGVQISSSGTPVGVFTLYGRVNPAEPWTVMYSVSNPSGTLPFYVGPGMGEVKGVLSGVSSGTYRCGMRRAKP